MRKRPAWKRLLRRLLVSVVSVLIAAGLNGSSTSAAEPPAGARREQQRREVEATLDRDVEWDVGDKKTVTLAEFIAHVKAKHALTIRWDVATFRGLVGADDVSSSGIALSPRNMLGAVAVPIYSAGIPPVSPSEPSPVGTPDGSSPVTQPGASNYGTNPYGTLNGPRSSSIPANSSPSPYGGSASSPPSPYVPGNPEPKASSALEATVAPPVAAVNADGQAPPPSSDRKEPSEPSEKPAAPIPDPSEGPSKPATEESPRKEVAKPASPADESPEAHAPKSDEPDGDAGMLYYEQIAHAPVSIDVLAIDGATIRETLGHFLQAVSPPMTIDMEMGVPFGSRALEFDYLVDGRSVLITTHMQANFRKETRVYSLANLKGVPPAELSRVLTHSVHPWSWRLQANEVADKLAARMPKSGKLALPALQLSPTDLLKLTSSDSSNGDYSSSAPPATPAPSISSEDLRAASDFFAGAAVTVWEMGLAAVEMIYHAEPPTATIQTLPGMLIINQSQAAHREIADLLDQMREASKAGE